MSTTAPHPPPPPRVAISAPSGYFSVTKKGTGLRGTGLIRDPSKTQTLAYKGVISTWGFMVLLYTNTTLLRIQLGYLSMGFESAMNLLEGAITMLRCTFCQGGAYCASCLFWAKSAGLTLGPVAAQHVLQMFLQMPEFGKSLVTLIRRSGLVKRRMVNFQP